MHFAWGGQNRVVAEIFTGALVGAVLCGAGTGTAAADPAPAGCTAADLARESAVVASETEKYLAAHSDANDFFTDLKNTQHDDVQQKVESYMAANPQVHDDLKRIRQPRTDLQKRCNWASDELPD